MKSFLKQIVEVCLNHFSVGFTDVRLQRYSKMETGEQAHRERAIQLPTFLFIQPAHRVLYPVSSSKYLFIMRVNVSQLHGQFNNCICFAAVM